MNACFCVLDPDAFERCLVEWPQALSTGSGGQLVAIDGKRIRRSFTHAWAQSTATHLVSAFITSNATVFSQLAVDSKENEIVAIPKLLALLDLRGATPQIDWLGSKQDRWAGLRSVCAASKYIAIHEQSQCRIRLVYVRTSKAPNPASCFPRSNHFSTCQRPNPTVIIFFRGILAGALLTKYLISSVRVFRATISQ